MLQNFKMMVAELVIKRDNPLQCSKELNLPLD